LSKLILQIFDLLLISFLHFVSSFCFAVAVMSALRYVLKTDRPITSMALSDQSCVVVGQENNRILLRTQKGEECLYKFRAVHALTFSPNGHLLAYGSSNDTVGLWDTQTKEHVAIFQGDSFYDVISVVFAPDGSLLASASHNTNVRLWDVVGRKASSPVHVLQGHTNFVRSVAFSPDGRQLASGSYDRTVRLWTVPQGAPGPVLQHAYVVYCVAFSPVVGSNMLASGCDDCIVRLWDVSGTKQQVLRELQGHSRGILKVAFSPDGSQLVSGSYDRTVRLWNVASGKLLKTLTGHSKAVTCVAFHPNGKQVASCANDKTVRIWTVCEWSDRTHQLFGKEMKRLVFCLMCIKEQISFNENSIVPQLPIELWLEIFRYTIVFALD
jgi:WD40 repeat protein